jgi:hypothetical protein
MLLGVMVLRGMSPTAKPALKPFIDCPLSWHQIGCLLCTLILVISFNRLYLLSDFIHLFLTLLQIHTFNLWLCYPFDLSFKQLALILLKWYNFGERLWFLLNRRRIRLMRLIFLKPLHLLLHYSFRRQNLFALLLDYEPWVSHFVISVLLCVVLLRRLKRRLSVG